MPLPVAPLRENQGHETDRFAAAQPRVGLIILNKTRRKHMGNSLSPEIRKLACDLITKAYEHHKTHARFEETQRAWMVTAYFTFTALVFVGLAQRYTDPKFGGVLCGMVGVHFLVSILFMISVSKVSGEFRRHFTRAEKILSDVKLVCKDDQELADAFRNVVLETAAIREDWSGKRLSIVLLSNAAVHAYMFSLISACDVYILLVGFENIHVFCRSAFAAALLWMVLSALGQHWYISKLERIGT